MWGVDSDIDRHVSATAAFLPALGKSCRPCVTRKVLSVIVQWNITASLSIDMPLPLYGTLNFQTGILPDSQSRITVVRLRTPTKNYIALCGLCGETRLHMNWNLKCARHYHDIVFSSNQSGQPVRQNVTPGPVTHWTFPFQWVYWGFVTWWIIFSAVPWLNVCFLESVPSLSQDWTKIQEFLFVLLNWESALK